MIIEYHENLNSVVALLNVASYINITHIIVIPFTNIRVGLRVQSRVSVHACVSQ